MNWDDAYQNGKYIANGEAYLPMWKVKSSAFRASLSDCRQQIGVPYGAHPREVFDLFLPTGTPQGVVIFIHGGYWQSLDHTLWSHLAAGPLARGWAVAMPGYVLCPEASIADITQSITRAIKAVGQHIKGDIILSGHSAGGHLAARMACDDITLPHAARVRRYVSISGLHDLRPLTRTRLNEALKLDMASATAESPALKTPREGVELLAWVGADERPEFLRQNSLIGNIWRGGFAKTGCVEARGKHHFSVIEALAEPDSPLVKAMLL
ncbi:MAG: alpha/beta hydrolase [Rhodobacteraceae bacterium]|nr:alpha/beta hydrolase [Paracoccaceae bacterium]